MEHIRDILIYPYELSIYFKASTQYAFDIKNINDETVITECDWGSEVEATRAGIIKFAELINNQ